MSTQKNGDSPLNYQVGGDHYRSMKVQPIEIIHCQGLHFSDGSALKYVSRWRKKGGIQDLEKAKQCLRFAADDSGLDRDVAKFDDFLNQFDVHERYILLLILIRHFRTAMDAIDELIAAEKERKENETSI